MLELRSQKLWDTSVTLIHLPCAHALLGFNFIFSFCIFHWIHHSFCSFWEGVITTLYAFHGEWLKKHISFLIHSWYMSISPYINYWIFFSLFGGSLPLVSPVIGEMNRHQNFIITIGYLTAYSWKKSLTLTVWLSPRVQKLVIPHLGYWALK